MLDSNTTGYERLLSVLGSHRPDDMLILQVMSVTHKAREELSEGVLSVLDSQRLDFADRLGGGREGCFSGGDTKEGAWEV